MNFRKSRARAVFEVFNTIFLAIVILVTVSPFILIIASSFSGIAPIIQQRVFFWPVEFTLEGYRQIFEDGSIFLSYYNTLWYVLVGVAISITVTMSGAYVLSRRYYSLRSQIMFMIAVTMFFNGGLVPNYILINQLGIFNTRWAIVIPGAVSAFLIVMARVFLQSTVPDELAEAAKIDGANDLQIFLRIALPLSKAIIAVLALNYGVGRWNSWFSEMLYLRENNLMPLSLFLRRLIITGGSAATLAGVDSAVQSGRAQDFAKIVAIKERMKFGSVIVTMLPIMMVYPFLQKYFVKGVMIGALKE